MEVDKDPTKNQTPSLHRMAAHARLKNADDEKYHYLMRWFKWTRPVCKDGRVNKEYLGKLTVDAVVITVGPMVVDGDKVGGVASTAVVASEK